MPGIESDLDLILGRLRKLIPERGFTQVEVQDVLGWGKSYISQLLNKQKRLRIDQILLILNVVGVDPGVFYGEIYAFGESGSATARHKHGTPPPPLKGWNEESTLEVDLRRLTQLLEGLVTVLKQKDLITAIDLASAVEKAKREPPQPLSPPD